MPGGSGGCWVEDMVGSGLGNNGFRVASVLVFSVDALVFYDLETNVNSGRCMGVWGLLRTAVDSEESLNV
jgi:hypothetical protein